jgi:hydroxymethylbilane synthase
VGTRGSALALAQARAVARLLDEPSELVPITTAGDVDRARGDKSRWVSSLERALLAGEIDLAVHSAKDVPGELAAGTVIAATPRRANPLDVLVGERSLAALREGARVGTSALRRRAQLLAARPDVQVVDLRGNVDTRLGKLAAGEVDALVLASAGLLRLGLRPDHVRTLDTGEMVPAPGQGALAVQARAGDDAAAEALRGLDHAESRRRLDAERRLMALIGGGCALPLGAVAEISAAGVHLRAVVVSPDGTELVEASATDPDPLRVAELVAEELLSAGAGEILARARGLT